MSYVWGGIAKVHYMRRKGSTWFNHSTTSFISKSVVPISKLLPRLGASAPALEEMHPSAPPSAMTQGELKELIQAPLWTKNQTTDGTVRAGEVQARRGLNVVSLRKVRRLSTSMIKDLHVSCKFQIGIEGSYWCTNECVERCFGHTSSATGCGGRPSLCG